MVSVIVAFSVIIIGITQTAIFRSWFRGVIEHAAASQLNGTLTLGTIHGNLITGIRIDSVAITMDGVTVISCDAILARYNPLRLPSQFISLAEVVIREPRITFIRGMHDSLWNIERLSKPKTTPGGPFTWTIDARDIELMNGSVDITDSAAPPTTSHAISLTHVSLRGVNLSAACKISQLVQDITINHCSVEEQTSGFRLRDLAGTVYRAPDTLRATLNRVVTTHSAFSLDIGMGRIDTSVGVAGLARFANVPLSLLLNADSISLDEAKLFSSALLPLAGNAGLSLNVHGTLENLAVKRCVLKLDRTALFVTGTLQHLDVPEKLFGDLQITKSAIVPKEVSTRLPGFALPDLSGLGVVSISQMTVKGTMKEFTTKFAMGGDAGSITGTASLDADDLNPKLNADVKMERIRLSGILPSLPASDITGHITLHGAGKSVMTFAGNVGADLMGSSINGRRIEQFKARAGLAHGVITIDTLAAALADSGGGLALTGTVDLHNDIGYDIHLVTEALNIAAVTKDEKRTQITSQIDLRGHGTNLDSVVIDPLVLRMSESRLYGRRVPPFNANITLLHPESGHTNTTIVSDLGVLTLNGRYRIDQAVEEFVGIGNNVAMLVADSIVPAFAAGAKPNPPDTVLEQIPPFVDATYTISILNPSLIAAFLETSIGGRTLISGTIHSDSSGAHQTMNAAFGGFMLHKDSLDIQFGKTNIDFAFNRTFTHRTISLYDSALHRTRNGRMEHPLLGVEKRIAHVDQNLSFHFVSDSLRVNGFALDSAAAHIAWDAGHGRFGASGMFPGTPPQTAVIDGEARFANGACTVLIDTLGYVSGDKYSWKGSEPGEIDFNHGAIAIRNLTLIGDSAVVRLAGGFADGKFNEMHLGVRRLSLAGLNKYSDGDIFRGLTGTIDSLSATIDGALEDPKITVPVIRGSNITFRGNRFGHLSARLQDWHSNAEGEIHIGDPSIDSTTAVDSSVHRLDIEVHSFPFNAALVSVEKRVPDGGATDVRVRANRFPITFMELLFGTTVDHVRGTMNGKIAIAGQTPAVRYNGTLSLADAKFHSLSTNISYEAHGDFVLYNDTLEIVSAEIANRDEDLKNSWARIWGNLYFRGLTFNSFDIYCEADQIMVLSRASRSQSSTVYGPLVIATQPRERRSESIKPDVANAIHFYGTVQRPYLEGTIYTQESDLIFPRSTSADDGSSFTVKYDLEARHHVDSTVKIIEALKGPMTATIEAEQGGGLLDNMRYNLRIITETDLRMTMDFSETETLKNLRLSGELVFLRGDDGRPHLSGPLYINGGIYSFFDEFTIAPNSRMIFIDSIENPQLSIIAATPPRVHQPTTTSVGAATEFVQVKVEITGTRQTPIVTVHLFTGPTSNSLVERGGNADRNRNDALTFLATGQFFDDYANSNGVGTGAGSTLKTGGSTIGSSVLSSALGSMFSSLGLPGRVDVHVDKEHPELSKVNVSGQAGKFLVSAGLNKNATFGTVDASVAFSLGDVLRILWLEQTRITVEQRAVENSGRVAQSPIYSVRIGALDFFTAIGRGAMAFWNFLFGPAEPVKSPPTSGADSLPDRTHASR